MSTSQRSSPPTPTSSSAAGGSTRARALVVSEWTATATKDGKKLEWDGIDVFPIENGKIKRKDVYSGFGVAREIS